jgi:putative Mg2+ transporter-C (MgtC) family protein
MPPEETVIVRVLIGTALGFALGFERGLRGSPAGDRTFSLVGASAAAITAVFYQRSPQVVAGVVTGIGFIGGGVVLHGQGALIRGVTTAATVFATAALGILVGTGYGVAAAVLAALLLVILEIRYISPLRYVNSQHFQDRVRQESDSHDRRD